MEILTDIRLSPIPEPKMVLAEIRTLGYYFDLYWYFSNGGALRFGFPQKHLDKFPDRSYKQLLMTAIANQMNTVNMYMAIQNDYLKNYYELYLHYANGIDIPSDFPESIIDQFPNRSCIHQLQGAITALQHEINTEKITM